MTQNVVSRLLIIGNGFDLNCGLKSSFEDYYDNEIKMVEILKKMNSNFNDRNTDTNVLKSDILRSAGFQGIYGNLYDNIEINFNDEGISFWDFYFYSHKEKLNNWSDVEYFLNNLLTINNDNEHLEFDLENSLDIVNRLKYLKPRVTIKDSFLTEFKKLRDDTFTTDKETLILLFVLLNNLKYDIDKHSKKYFFDFLYNELNKFEESFGQYLKNSINDSYKDYSEQLLQKLVNNECYNLLSFNYTSPYVESTSFNTVRNIHGKLDNCPIIGIDSKGIVADSPVFRFTKTYRIMTLASDKQDRLLPKSIKTIAFYGHSLAPADYSYFQSIFDYYNIYDNDITLVFYYSIYDESKEQEIRRTQFHSVTKLISKYGTTFHNEKGENLMHKLLLEGRLILKKID